MKKMLFKICLITLLVLCSLSLYLTTCMADSSLDDIMNNGNSFLNAGSESSTMIDQNDLKSLSNFISGVLLTIAIGVTVITGAIMGLNFITQSIEEKAKVKESMVPWIIGIIVSFGAFTIWEVAVNLFQSL